MEVQGNKRDFILLSEYIAMYPCSPLPPITIIDDTIATKIYDTKSVNVDVVYYRSGNLTTLNGKMIEEYGGKIYNSYHLSGNNVILPDTNFWTFKLYMFKVLNPERIEFLNKLMGL